MMANNLFNVSANEVKKAKMRNILMQRSFLMSMLLTTNPDGNAAVPYFGTIFPENKAFLKEKGFDVETRNFASDEVAASIKCMAINVISFSDRIEVSPEEFDAYAQEMSQDVENMRQGIAGFMDLMKERGKEQDDAGLFGDLDPEEIARAFGEKPEAGDKAYRNPDGPFGRVIDIGDLIGYLK